MRLRPWLLVSAAWLGPAILGAIDQIAQRRLAGQPVNFGAILFTSGDWLLCAVYTPIVFAVARRWPLTRSRIAFHVVLALLFCVAWAGIGTLLKLIVFPAGVWGGPRNFFISWLFITMPFGLVVYFALIGTAHATRLSEQLSAARLAALQATVNPHFFFNTLNTLGVLVREGDSGAATHIIEEFSEVMRRVLRRHASQQVTIAEELELVRHFLAIEQARFSDRLRITMDVDDAVMSAAVPSFALQHLIDNAIRHGIARRSEAGSIIVRGRREGDAIKLEVIDDGPGWSGDAPPGHGIENTRERLRALYGDSASLTISVNSPTGTIATLRIPYREVVFDIR